MNCFFFNNNNQKEPPWTCSVKKMFVEILKNSQENTCVRVFFLNKVAGLKHGYFPVNFGKFLRTSFLQNTSGELLLNNDYNTLQTNN